jgi:hypothetical protein
MHIAFRVVLISLLFAGSSFASDKPRSETVVYEFGKVPRGACAILDPQSRSLELREGDPRADREYGGILQDQIRSVQLATEAQGGNAVLIVRQLEAIGLDGVWTYETDAYSLRCAASAR